MAIIPEQNHATSNCGCNELSLGNNLEGRVFTVICLLREFVKPATIPEPYGDPVEHAEHRLAQVHELQPGVHRGAVRDKYDHSPLG